MTIRKIMALVVLGLAFLTCNVEPDIEHRINLFLNDSLSYDRGVYKRLRISIYDANDSTLQADVFDGPFHFDSSQGTLRGLLIGRTKPDRYTIRIVAYQGEDSATFEIPVENGQAGKLIVTSPLSGTIKPIGDPAVPQEVHLVDSVLTLGFFGETGTSVQIYPILKPAGSVGVVQYRSDNPLVAEVDENGLIVAKGIGTTFIWVTLVSLTHLSDTVTIHVKSPPTIQSVNWVREFAAVYVGAPARKLNTTHNPSELEPILGFFSSDTGVIAVTPEGWVKAKRAGSVVITVSALGLVPVEDTLHLHAVVDAPVLEVGPSQKVSVGQQVNIPIRVTQQFGTVRLSWDFDGDKIADTVVAADNALATHVYAQTGDFSVEITAEDGEGNITSKTVRVQVGKPGPLVIITSHKSDTLVNTPDLTVTYTSDGVEKHMNVRLDEGPNRVTARDSNATGMDSVSINIRLDTKNPMVKIIEPANGAITRLPNLDVTWTADLVVQATKNKEVLSGRQGKISIVRRYIDSAGNAGMDSIAVTYDSIPPGPPVFLTTDSITNRNRPVWEWKSGGGGNGLFSYQLGTSIETITNQAQFSPSAVLDDGKHTLHVREQDVAGNWSLKSSKTITIKSVKPASPTFVDAATTISPTKNTRPVWKWKSSGSAGGGVGLFQFNLDTTVPIQREDTSTGFSPANDLPDGVYTLKLQERDAYGNWSEPISRSISVLTQGAKVTITQPVRGFHSNVKTGSMQVEWNVGGVRQDSQTNFTLTKEGQWNLLRREFRDAANNLTFDTLSVFWDTTAPKVIITYPKNGSIVNKSSIPVAWSIDGALQSAQQTEPLGLTEGDKTVTRSFVDKAGNTGIASHQVSLRFFAPAFTRIRKILVLDRSAAGASAHLESRRDLNTALSELATENGFSVTTLKQTDSLSAIAAAFSQAKIQEHQVIVFSNNDGVGGMLDSLSKANVEKYVNDGGTLIAVHAASAFISGWPWLTNSLVQSYYNHAANQPRATLVHDAQAMAGGTATSGVFKNLIAPTGFMDEYYSFRGNPRSVPGVTVLATVDEGSFDKTIQSPMGADHPVVWAYRAGKGYVVNFSLGHSWSTNNAYSAHDSYLKKLLYGVMRFGSGDFVGCTDPTDTEFNPDATQDDPSQCGIP